MIAMNIGDGLLFELENGKPKLILLKRGAEKNSAKQLSFKPRPAKFLSSKQQTCAEEVHEDECPARQQSRRHREVRSKAEGGVSTAHSFVPATQTEGRKTKIQGQRRQDRVKVVAKEGEGTDEKEALADGDAALKNNVAVLTNDQMGPKSSGSSKQRGEPAHRDEERMEEVKETETTVYSQENVIRASGCTFSWLEEQLSHGAASGARKAQWRKDLDEQMEQKQLHSAPVRLQDGGGSASHTEQHAAIRSSLRLGDVSPIEMELNIEKREEQRRRWLQELDCQRQEMMERRRREKLLQNQVEDHERWMAHFDSLQRPVRAGTPSAPPEVQLCRAEQGGWEPSSSLSLAWDVSSSCGADSLVGASVDSTSRCQTRSSYLRTMTSLLDPAQIEGRERRRIKQLEQQRAIEAQMEERRNLRKEEETKRREEEEREERRLAREREMLQKQYELETRKEKEQPEVGQDAIRQQTSRGSRKEVGLEGAGVSSLRDTAVQTETADGVQTLDVAVQYHPPAPRPTAPPTSRRLGKENISEPAGGDLYEPFARTERRGRGKRRPVWNTQRPTRRPVPASERYPPDLQRERQKNRLKRQAELLALQERARPLKAERPPPHSQEPHLCPPSQLSRTGAPPCRKVETESGERSGGPAVRSDRWQQPPGSPPPEFVPYVRTEEVRLDPLEPAGTPPPHTNPGPPSQSPAPLVHTRRQQQILRGLAQLRQGLLQKQKELERDLQPPEPPQQPPTP